MGRTTTAVATATSLVDFRRLAGFVDTPWQQALNGHHRSRQQRTFRHPLQTRCQGMTDHATVAIDNLQTSASHRPRSPTAPEKFPADHRQ
jgi:hypothetical protein